jgi:hypothetical protein
MAQPQAKAAVLRHFPGIRGHIPFAEESSRLIEIMRAPFVRVPEETIAALDAELKGI